MAEPKESNDTVVHVSPTVAVFILGIIFSLIGAIYVNINSTIAQAKAEQDDRISALEQTNGTESLEVTKIATNVAIICVTVNAKCQ